MIMSIRDAYDIGKSIYNFIKGKHNKKEIQEKFNDNVVKIMVEQLYQVDGIEGVRIIRNYCDTFLKVKKKDSPMGRIRESATGKVLFSKETEHTPAIKELIDYFEENKLQDRTHKIKIYCLHQFKKEKRAEREDTSAEEDEEEANED